MDRLALMKTFVRVLETGSFSAAARHLNVGQSAVSKSIAQLEDRLGVRLLMRSTHSLTPTEAGQIYYERARRVIDEADEDKNRVGPYLHGVIGRPAGTAEGFKYSDAMKDSGIVWSEETIAEYVADPKAYVPGNRMAFPGLKKEEDIKNLIAYLKEESQ